MAIEEHIEPVKAGELKDRDLQLVQTDKVRKKLSKATKSHYALLKLKAAKLDWKRK